MARDPEATRQRILKAADDLFYEEGILKVSVDAIAERAGVTKRTLYYHYRSKDDLIAAYLEAREGSTLSRNQHWMAKTKGPMSARLKGMFGELEAWASRPRWKGCGFARAAAELAGLPGHPALAVASRHKHTFEAWFRAGLEAEGYDDAATKARQIMILLDGAITEILIHRDPSYARSAAAAIDALLAPRPPRQMAEGSGQEERIPA